MILVVDDDEVFRRRLSRAFIERGLSVLEASGGEKAIQLARKNKIKNVILDLKMPGMLGLEILKELLAYDETIKIVILTGYGSIATAVEAVKLGAVNYLTKPIDPDTILKAFDLTSKHTSADLPDPLGPDLLNQPGTLELKTPYLSQVEWDHIQRVVQDCNGNISLASKKLGLHRRSLQRKLAKIPGSLF